MITITEVGANRVTDSLVTRGKGLGLRVKVRTTGCSGYAYVLEFVDELNGFQFKNPWEDATCGCGESFTLKK